MRNTLLPVHALALCAAGCSAAVWLDGDGKPSFLFNAASKARWEDGKSSLDRLLGR